jgi:Lipid A 3-O-deacylase (PagL)
LKSLFFKSILFITVFLFSSEIVSGQQERNTQDITNRFRFVDLRSHFGTYLKSAAKAGEAFKNNYTSVELRLGWQTDKEDGWQSRYFYPTYGIGGYIGFLNGGGLFGNPTALYGFVDFPVSRQKRNTLNISMNLGFSYRLNPYKFSTNPDLDTIGSRLGVFFSFNLNWVYKLNRETDLLYGIDLTHFSNGRTVTPNFGINMYALNLGIRYNFNLAQKIADPDRIHPQNILLARPNRVNYNKIIKKKEHVVELYQAFGTVQNKMDAGTSNRYLTSSTVLDYAYRFSELGRINAGFDFFIDGSTYAFLGQKENTIKNKSYLGMHVGYDFSFSQFMIRFQIGTYLKDGVANKGNFYMRPAFRWEPREKLFFAQVGLKTLNGAVSDWIEYGIGFKLYKKKIPMKP